MTKFQIFQVAWAPWKCMHQMQIENLMDLIFEEGTQYTLYELFLSQQLVLSNYNNIIWYPNKGILIVGILIKVRKMIKIYYNYQDLSCG